jgi:hypothetical protein
MPNCPAIGKGGWKYDRSCAMALNQILYLQTEIVRLYMKQHKLQPKAFLELDKKYDILEFLEIGYEPFHLTGPQGVLNELEDYVEAQRS